MRALVLVLLVPAPILAGCVDCNPETVPAAVTLSLAKEEARTLPMLASGGTRIAGVALPDSHGRLELLLNVTHNLSNVRVEGLRVALSVKGSDVPARVEMVEGGRGWHRGEDRAWSGLANAGGRLVVYWAVDREAVASAAALLLAEGAPYRATVLFSWRHDSCAYVAHGTVTQAFDDFVEASANARSFREAGRPFFEATATGAGFRANFTSTSGLELTVNGVEAKAAVLRAGAAGGIALVAFPTVGSRVENARSVVKPGEMLRVHSAADALTRSSYSASGTVAPPGAAEHGLVVLVVDVAYAPKDATVGVARDVFAFGLVR